MVVCKCGHGNFEHCIRAVETEKGYIDGGGSCKSVGCDCQQFVLRPNHEAEPSSKDATNPGLPLESAGKETDVS